MNSTTNDAPQCATFVASLSDVGRVRSVNEDGFDSLVRTDGTRLLVVADGMGGHRGGAVASREAIAAIGATFDAASPAFDAPALLSQAITEANARVFSLAHQDPELSGMGTTVVALLLDPTGRATVAHVGDSRAYRFRQRRLEPLTQDHSVVAEMLQRGVLTPEEAAYHPRRNEILRSVGVLRDVQIDVGPVEVAAGDWFLLCSDGLCGVVSDAEIEEVLVASASPEDAVAALVDLANDCGGPDNVTVQILAVESMPNGSAASASSNALAGSGRAATNGMRSPGGATAATRFGSTPATSADDATFPAHEERASNVRSRAVPVIAALAFFAAVAWWLARHPA